MDLVTHALLGAAVAIPLVKPSLIKPAALVGALAALGPDIDVFFGSANNPLQLLDYHRHFTHSLLFAPIGALLIALVFRLLRFPFSFRQLFIVCLAAWLSACLLDWCTSYGTRLLWPLLPDAFALSIIAVVDPVFTLVLAVGVAISLLRKQKKPVIVALMLGLGYLIIGSLQHQRALTAAQHLVMERHLTAHSVQVKPTLGNMLLWRSLIIDSDNSVTADAIRVGLSVKIYPGEQQQLLTPEKIAALPLTDDHRDLLLQYQQRHHPVLLEHSEAPLFIGDARYSLLPVTLNPLWGLEFETVAGDEQVSFTTRRTFTPAMRDHFVQMLMGQSLNN